MVLKNRFAYDNSFSAPVIAQAKKVECFLPFSNASSLHQAFNGAFGMLNCSAFGNVVVSLILVTPDEFDAILHKLKNQATNSEQIPRFIKFQTFMYLRPCIAADKLLHAKGCLECAKLPTATKHPVIFPARHSLTHCAVCRWGCWT